MCRGALLQCVGVLRIMGGGAYFDMKHSSNLLCRNMHFQSDFMIWGYFTVTKQPSTHAHTRTHQRAAVGWLRIVVTKIAAKHGERWRRLASPSGVYRLTMLWV